MSGYLFKPRKCPNANHPADAFPTGRCDLCGTNVQAHRVGARIAAVTLAVVAVAVVVALSFLAARMLGVL